MKFWQVLSFAEPEQLPELAQIAEEVGFEGVMLSDHLFVPATLESRYPYGERPVFDVDTPWPDPWVTIGAMAALTERLRFATLVQILPLRHPIEIAKAVGTAALLSGGRVALGTGAGWIREEFDALGVDFATRGRRYDEMLDVMRALWRGEMVEHHGEHFDFPRILMRPAPPAPVPIWIGGASAPALRRAARLGDGWLGTGQSPDEVLACLSELARLRREAGRAEEPFEAIAPLAVEPTPDVLTRLAEAGLTGTTAWPFTYALGPRSSAAAKRAVMERFAEGVIAKWGGG